MTYKYTGNPMKPKKEGCGLKMHKNCSEGSHCPWICGKNYICDQCKNHRPQTKPIHTPHGAGSGGEGGRASPDTGTSAPCNQDILARINHLKSVGVCKASSCGCVKANLQGISETLDWIEGEIDNKINEVLFSEKPSRYSLRELKQKIAEARKALE